MNPGCLLCLTHWGRGMHICVSKLTIIVSDNGLSPGRRQAIIWTNTGILLIEPYGTNFSEILIAILTFSFTKMSLKVSSAKWHPFCVCLNELIWIKLTTLEQHCTVYRKATDQTVPPPHRWFLYCELWQSIEQTVEWIGNAWASMDLTVLTVYMLHAGNQGLIPQKIPDHAWNLPYSVLLLHSNSNDPIRPQICTCHDSWAVMAWANLWHDWITIFCIRTIHNLVIFELYIPNLLNVFQDLSQYYQSAQNTSWI